MSAQTPIPFEPAKLRLRRRARVRLLRSLRFRLLPRAGAHACAGNFGNFRALGLSPKRHNRSIAS
jgi:hypothetical protein